MKPEDMAKLDDERVAHHIVERARLYATMCHPHLTNAVIRWHGGTYIGGVQGPFDISPPELASVVYLSKSTYAMPDGLIARLRRLAPDWLEFEADEDLDLEGRSHLLRRVGPRLCRCTPDQTAYYLVHGLPKIVEVHLP